MAKGFRNILAVLGMAALLSGGPSASGQEAASAFSDTNAVHLAADEPLVGVLDVSSLPHTSNAAAPDARQWQAIVSRPAYSYRDRLEYQRSAKPPEPNPWMLRWLEAFFRFFDTRLGKLLLWGVFLAIAAYFLFRVLRGQAGGLFSRRGRSFAKEDDEAPLSAEGLLDADWEAQMQQALAANDGRSALRFGYLQLLQLLHNQGLILYRPDKTNNDYLHELGDAPQRTDFRSITRQYERAWFGHQEPDQRGLDSFFQTFQRLTQSFSRA
jgi:hypothetical protein